MTLDQLSGELNGDHAHIGSAATCSNTRRPSGPGFRKKVR
jgi:hypothetical protein